MNFELSRIANDDVLITGFDEMKAAPLDFLQQILE
jgi:hypothetical protein